MIKSLRKVPTTQTSFLKTANVSLQPTPKTVVVPTTSSNTSVAKITVPVKNAILSQPLISLLQPAKTLAPPKTGNVVVPLRPGTEIGKMLNPTIKKVVQQVVSNRKVLLPIRASYNVVFPVRPLSLNTGRLQDSRAQSPFVATTTPFTPYESLTGITQERPEIVMMTNFQPLFNVDVSHNAPHFINVFEDAGQLQFMTAAGHFMNAQFHMRNLRAITTQNLISQVVGDIVRPIGMYYQSFGRANAYSAHLNEQMRQRHNDFGVALTKLKSNANYLLSLVRTIAAQKQQLDLRSDLHQVVPSQVANSIAHNYVTPNNLRPNTPQGTTRVPAVLQSLVQRGQRVTYGVDDCMVDIGFNPDSVKNVFASTKIWMQLMVELKEVLKTHSLKFLDISTTWYRNDQNATSINKPPVKRFELADNLPLLPTLDELINQKAGNVNQSISVLQPAFVSIYQNVFFKNEEARIAALAHLLSREYRYSAGIAAHREKLRANYDYDVASSNQTLFDFVIGRHGSNITEMPELADRSLMTIAQYNAGQVGVLPFESKYIENDTSTLTPGGEFFFDRILEDTDGSRFDTSAMDAFASRLDEQANNFTSLCTALNLFHVPVNTGYRNQSGVSKQSNDHFLMTSTDTVNELASRLINPRTGEAHRHVVNDRLGAVYAQARKDNRVKTALFLYTLTRISRAYSFNVPFLSSARLADNTPATGALITQVINALQASVPESRTTIQLVTQRGLDRGLNTASLTSDSITHALKSGTEITRAIEQFMSSVLAQFRTKSQALNGNHTLYGGYLDTVVAMIAFDFAIAMVARYSNQQLVGVHRGLTTFSRGQITFAIAQTATNHMASFNELNQRITGEENFTRQLLMAVINTMRNISGSFKNLSSYLNGAESLHMLKEISVTLGNDPMLLRMLLQEQQIMLLASTVDNLQHAANALQLQGGESSHDDGNRLNTAIAILDESDVPPQMHQALLGYFGTGEFASVRGNNKRIMTVGIPLGFAESLKQKVNVRRLKRTSFGSRQNDIVYVSIYKVDLQNSDIIYKPIRFLFELSRFPTRFTTQHWLPLPHKPALSDIVNSIPTQCYDTNPQGGGSVSIGIEYASEALARKSAVKGARTAFSDPSYSFLTARQKAEILQNHVISQLLEVYIKLMTGVNVAEYNYYMSEPPPHVEADILKNLMEHSIANVAERIKIQKTQASQQQKAPPARGVLFSTTARLNAGKGLMTSMSGIAGKVSTQAQFGSPPHATQTQRGPEQQQQQIAATLEANLDTLGSQHVDLVTSHLRTVTNFAQTLSTLSNVDALNHKILTPKDFDRVFNVIFDPRDFEIDVAQTMETPHGRQALALLLKHGDVVPADYWQWGGSHWLNPELQVQAATSVMEGRSFPQNRFPSNINNFKFRDRDKNQGDLIADKYFVTIETFDEEEV